jgi:hypothetical protein
MILNKEQIYLFRQFIRFLRRKKAIDVYFSCLKEGGYYIDRKRSTAREFIVHCLKYEPHKLIVNAFSWSDAQEIYPNINFIDLNLDWEYECVSIKREILTQKIF